MSLMKSESIDKLVTALAVAKAAFSPVLKLSENPGFKRNGQVSKYADLATAIAATEDALLANGLVVSQFPVNDGERVGALTLITHSSGEYMGEAFTLPLAQQTAQTGVAAVTYARRAGYLAALGIAAEDDDGQTAAGQDDDTRTSENYTHNSSTTELPDFQDAQRGPVKATPAPSGPSPKVPQEAPAASATSAAGSPAPVSAPPEHGDAYEGPEDSALPTEAELTEYRVRFKKLTDQLVEKGKLNASKGLPASRKLLVFLVSITKASGPKTVNKSQWDNFFTRADAAVANPEVGLVGLTKLVNKANGLEEKK